MTSAYIMSRILYRDAVMLVVDKPAGLPVHPDRRGGPTVADWLDELRFGLPRRPEVAHRLDRDTSGCLVLGRHARALARLGELFASGQVEKTYWALVAGSPASTEGEIDLPIAPRSRDPHDWRVRVDPRGRPALTRWRVLGGSGEAGQTWLELVPVTGRTHQLRVHCAASGWPIVGDATYGPGRGTLMLHARSVAVPLYPKKPPILVDAPVPDAIATALARFA